MSNHAKSSSGLPRATPRDPLLCGWTWVPILILFLAILALWVTDVRTELDSPVLLMLVNFLTRTLASGLIVYLAGRSFLVRRTPGVLLLGCGVAVWGASGFITTSILSREVNLGVTISNLGVWLAALCHLAGAMLARRAPRPLRAAGAWLAAGYALALGLVGLVMLATFAGWLPVFFVEGQGGTLVRHLVLGSSLAMFVLAAVLLRRGNRDFGSSFARWYACALLLIAVGVFGMLLQTSRGSLLNWTCRTAQYLGGIYMLVAALAARRETGGWKISLATVEQAWRRGEWLPAPGKTSLLGLGLRYGLAVVVVAAGWGLRQTITAWVGPGLPLFILFYPAVMVAGLLGGFGPGLTATGLTVLVDLWIIPPAGSFGISSPVDRVALILFAGMGVLVSGVAELYRQNKEKSVAYEREAAASRSQKTFVELIERSPFGTYVVDAQFRIAIMNAASQDGAFRNVRSVIGRDFAETIRILWPEAVAAEIIGHFRHTLETGEPYFSRDFVNPRADAEIVEAYEWELHRMTLPDGQHGVVCYYYDSTKLRQAEEQAAGQRAQLESVFEAVEDGISVFDMAGNIVLLNEAQARMLGYPDGAAMRKDLSCFARHFELGELDRRVIPVQDWPATRVLRGETVANRELLARRTDTGQTWFLSESAAPVRDSQGRQILGVVITRDITRRKRAEAALQESEERFRTMANAMPQLAWVAQPDGFIVWYNQRWYQYTGTTPEQMEGWGWQSVHDPVELPKVLERWKASIATGEAFEMTFPLRGADAVFRLFLTRGFPLKDADGRVVQWFGTNTDVTTLKQTEEALHASEERFRVAQELSPDGFSILRPVRDPQGRVVDFTWVYANTATVHIVGMGLPLLAGRSLLELFPGRRGSPFLETYRQVAETGQTRIQESLSQGDGVLAQSWFRVAVVSMGQDIAVLSQDITERKQAEAAVRASEERFRGLVEQTPDGIFVADAQGRYLDVNSAGARILGYTPAEICRLSFADVLAPEEMARIPAEVAKYADGAVVTGEWRFKRKDGSFFIGEVVGRQLPDGRLQGILRDITARKHAEEALRVSEERLAGIVGSAMDAVISVDERQQVLLFNSAAAEMFGCSVAEAMGQPLGRFIPSRFRSAHEQHIRQFGETGVTARQMGALGEVSGLRANGEEFPIEASISQVNVAGRKLFTVILRDITERKQAEERLKLSLNEKDVLLREIHHRVKNNLQVISSLVSLQVDSLNNPSLSGLLQDVRDRVRSMALVHETLYQSETLAQVDFAAYTRSLMSYLWRAHQGTAGIQLNLDLEPVTLSMDAAVPCGLLLSELVTNALKHAFPEHAKGEVTVALHAGPPGRVRLRVLDDGIGLPADLDWRQSGSLGLQLVRMLAGQLGASVEIKGGVGTEFVLDFAAPVIVVADKGGRGEV